MISTDTDPLAVQQALEKVQELEAEEEVVETPPTRFPVDGTVKLCGGLIDPTGVIDTATVRELNGRDEEAIVKAPNIGKAMLTILNRGVETLGGERPDADDLDSLLAADRDLLLVRIRSITFGDELELNMQCPECGETSEIVLNLTDDIPVEYLEDPIRDRSFTVELRNGGVAEVRLPTGITQKNVASASSTKSIAELNTMMLYGCVKMINDRDVIDISQILNLGIADRNAIVEELNKRSPGPQWDKIAKECTNCGEEVSLPLSADQLFRL